MTSKLNSFVLRKWLINCVCHSGCFVRMVFWPTRVHFSSRTCVSSDLDANDTERIQSTGYPRKRYVFVDYCCIYSVLTAC